MTIGQDRVRVKFNPSDDSLVAQIKQKTAELIDLCEEIPNPQDYEVERYIEFAQKAYEEAGMWAVKAATVGK